MKAVEQLKQQLRKRIKQLPQYRTDATFFNGHTGPWLKAADVLAILNSQQGEK